MNFPYISFVIPTYNSKEYICKTIDKIKLLLPKDYFEILVIDDFSSDDTFSFVSLKYKNSNNIKVYQNIYKGVSNARNFGISVSNGYYINFVDSDDELNYNYWLTIEPLIKKKYDLILFGMIFRYTYSDKFKVIKNIIINKNQESFEELFINNYMTSSCNKLISKTFIISNNLFFESGISSYEDLIYSLSLYKMTNNFIAIEYPLYIYNLRSNSLSNSYKKDQFYNFSSILISLDNYMLSIPNQLKTINLINRQIYFIFIYSLENELLTKRSFKSLFILLKNYIEAYSLRKLYFISFYSLILNFFIYIKSPFFLYTVLKLKKITKFFFVKYREYLCR
jgi:glycosyltransferase involved in cell wall biosynthesis